MHALLINRIARGLRDADKEPLLPENTIQIRGTRGTSLDRKLVDWARRKLSMAVWFMEDPQGNLSTPLNPVFGVFAFRAILRGFFIGASFLPGADLLLEKKHLSLSVIGYYTSALHLVSSFNALQGHVMLSPIAGQPVVKLADDLAGTKMASGGTVYRGGSAGYSQAPKGLQAVCAILTKDGHWIFEGRNRSHSAMWRELRQLITESRLVPQWLDLFCRNSVYPTMKVDEERYLNEGLDMLIEARHQAVYNGFGMDDFSFDIMINQEPVDINIAARASNYRSLSYGMLNDVLKETTVLFNEIEQQCPQELERLLPQLCSMVYTPPFDLKRDFADTIRSKIDQVPGCNDWLAKVLATATYR
jgi:hypothetical protein